MSKSVHTCAAGSSGGWCVCVERGSGGWCVCVGMCVCEAMAVGVSVIIPSSFL